MEKKSQKVLVIMLAICLLMTLNPWASVFAGTEHKGDTLQSSMEYLVNECGQRIYATPNEDKAAAFVKEQFESFGYKDVELAKIELKNPAYSGRVIFEDGAADIMGNAYPANPTAGEFDAMTGVLVDLGTDAEYAVPEGITGEIVGAVRFDGAPTLAKVNEIISAVMESEEITLTGLLIARSGGTVNNQNQIPSIAGANVKPIVPCITTTNMFLGKALANAENFACAERYTRTETSAVIATKPAPGGDPDLIILVTSHMDSAAASPGASDNGSGVAANIELARRFADANLGNIEVRFAAVGAEEGGGMLGSVYLRDSLSEEEKAISIDLNMDMLCSPSSYNGEPLNAVSMDIYVQDRNAPLAFNLPAYLVTDQAKDVVWADGIDNVRIFRYGSSDHTKFTEVGIDAASMIIATDETDDIEVENHKSLDNLDNYSYERLLMCTDLIANGIQKAADQKISKRACFNLTNAGNKVKVTLHNASQLFKTYDCVEVTFASPDKEPFKAVFTQNAPFSIELTDKKAEITGVVAYGIGTADNLNAERNELYQNFQTKMFPQVVVKGK